ncbi:Phosphomethylpyrimidine synthase [Candidatus Methanoperedenaceae archaeon GB50]|nr:Phosphomethylpyrimidine synthase [Candidatus Methanoperedenaceae archaeon GB50]
MNTNIGTSSDYINLEEEVKKLEVAIKVGTDAVMDLSTGGNLEEIRKTLLKRSPIPFGTVPIYQAAIEMVHKKGGIVHMTVDHIFSVIERQAQEGVDFMTVHCGVTLQSLERLEKTGKVNKHCKPWWSISHYLDALSWEGKSSFMTTMIDF